MTKNCQTEYLHCFTAIPLPMHCLLSSWYTDHQVGIQVRTGVGLLHLPSSTSVTGLLAICCLLGMEWQIWLEKLLLPETILLQEEGGLARELFNEQLDS